MDSPLRFWVVRIAKRLLATDLWFFTGLAEEVRLQLFWFLGWKPAHVADPDGAFGFLCELAVAYPTGRMVIPTMHLVDVKMAD